MNHKKNHAMKRSYPFLILLFFIFSCSSYNKIKLTPTGFYKNDEVPKNIKNYKVYLHDSEGGVLTAESPALNGDTLTATFVKYENVSTVDNLDNENKKAVRDEIHIYTSEKIKGEDLSANKQITSDQMKEVEMYAKEENRVFGLFKIIIGAVVIGVVIVLGIFFLIGKSAG